MHSESTCAHSLGTAVVEKARVLSSCTDTLLADDRP